jgi:hypothetical protein
MLNLSYQLGAGGGVGNGGGMTPRIHRGVDLILYPMSSLLLDGLTTMAVSP